MGQEVVENPRQKRMVSPQRELEAGRQASSSKLHFASRPPLALLPCFLSLSTRGATRSNNLFTLNGREREKKNDSKESKRSKNGRGRDTHLEKRTRKKAERVL